jgi:hypothetical protein
MKNYSSQDFKITGDGETKTISKEEFLELFRAATLNENDVTIFGYIDTDGWINVYQGQKEITFRQETLRNLAAFALSSGNEIK